MPLFRAVRRLSKGNGVIEPGALTDLVWLTAEQQEKLIQVGAVSRLAAPPLAILPGWTQRAKLLIVVGIETAEDLLTADVETVMEAAKVKPATVERWKEEARGWLVLPAEQRR